MCAVYKVEGEKRMERVGYTKMKFNYSNYLFYYI